MRYLSTLLLLLFLITSNTHASSLADTVEKIKPSVVGIGIYTPTGRPKNVLTGSGFVVGNGHYIVTNHHVLPETLDAKLLQQIAIFVGSGKSARVITADIVGTSEEHDLALLKISGKALPAMVLGTGVFQREGSDIAFTGFPIGAVLGLYPVTHRGIIASVTPTIIPVTDSKQISIKMLKRMRDPYLVYQLDATAYPGNSGSAMYDQETGEVVGVINKVFVQQSKEAVITNPSGITYAIPVKYVRALLDKHKIVY